MSEKLQEWLDGYQAAIREVLLLKRYWTTAEGGIHCMGPSPEGKWIHSADVKSLISHITQVPPPRPTDPDCLILYERLTDPDPSVNTTEPERKIIETVRDWLAEVSREKRPELK